MKVRKRLPDGTLGPFEEVFPSQLDETVLMVLEALAGQQEQIMLLENEIAELKGAKA